MRAPRKKKAIAPVIPCGEACCPVEIRPCLLPDGHKGEHDDGSGRRAALQAFVCAQRISAAQERLRSAARRLRTYVDEVERAADDDGGTIHTGIGNVGSLIAEIERATTEISTVRLMREVFK